MTHAHRTLELAVEDGVATIRFSRTKDTNAFSREMTLETMAVCRELASATPAIDAVILTGGTGRSFSVGGDFNDVSKLDQETEIRAYLGEIIDLYVQILKIDVPVVAAIDGFAIGQGLQVALMADWRIGAESCQLQMPELKNGVACPLGSIILEVLLGRARMQELVFDCEMIDAAGSRALGLINQVVATDQLQAAARAMARRLAAYPRTPFVTTKRIHNRRLADALERGREDSSQAHVASFLQRSGQKHFEKILGSRT